MSNKPNTKKRTRPPVAAPARPWWQSPLLAIGALVLIAAIAAIAINSADDDEADESNTAETAFAEALGTPLPVLSQPDLAIGTTPPILSAQTFNGDRVQLGNDGVARLYGFFAHWCPHCQADLPRTVKWLADNQLPDNVDVVAVSTSVDPTAANYPPSAWFERENWPGTGLIDDDENSLATGMGVSSFPYWVAVNADGAVVQRADGELTDEQFSALIAAISPS